MRWCSLISTYADMPMQTWKNTGEMCLPNSLLPSLDPILFLYSRKGITVEADIQSHRLSTENWEQSPLPTSFNTQHVALLPRHYHSFKYRWQHPSPLQQKLSLGKMDICAFEGTLARQKQACGLAYWEHSQRNLLKWNKWFTLWLDQIELKIPSSHHPLLQYAIPNHGWREFHQQHGYKKQKLDGKITYTLA